MSRKEDLNAEFEKLFANEAFMSALKNCRSESEFLSLLADHGVHMTAEENSEAKAEAKAVLENLKDTENAELSEEMLEDMAGGGTGWILVKNIAGGAFIIAGCATANPFFAAAGGMLLAW